MASGQGRATAMPWFCAQDCPARGARLYLARAAALAHYLPGGADARPTPVHHAAAGLETTRWTRPEVARRHRIETGSGS